MKSSFSPTLFLAAILSASSSCAFGQAVNTPATNSAPAQPIGPRMKFLESNYDFGKVVSGEIVKHTYIVSNAGDQILIISKIAPGCHCTTVGSHVDKVEPGQTGNIDIQFDSSAFHGPITRSITVTANDKVAPMQSLSLKGTIWQPIEVLPQFAYINVTDENASNAAVTLRITSKADEPITLSEPASANKLFTAALRETKPGKEFELTVTAVPPLPAGSNPGTITVKTSLTNKPFLNITAMAIVQPAVSVTPTQIALSPVISQWVTNTIIIAASNNKPLALSDPTASDPRIQLAIKEITAGRTYQLVMSFPPGFHLPEGQQAQVTVKSNNPQKPLIVVPVWQVSNRPSAHAVPVHPQAISQNPGNFHATTGNP